MEAEMTELKQVLMEEHAGLFIKINELHADVYGANNTDNKADFANKAIQLRAMRTYEDCLRARLKNQGIDFDGTRYLNTVGIIKESSPIIVGFTFKDHADNGIHEAQAPVSPKREENDQ